MALKKLMGQNLRTFVGGSVVAEATNCSITIQGNMEDGSTKDTDSAWTQESMTSKQWQVQVDSYDAALATLRGLITVFNADNKVSVGFDEAGGTGNAVAQSAEFARSGQAILNDLTIQADNRTNINVSAQYQGSGALA